MIYVPDGEEGIRRFGCELPFTLTGQGEGIGQQTRFTAAWGVCAVEAVLLNSRKALLKAELHAAIRCYNDVGDVFAAEAEDAEKQSAHSSRSSDHDAPVAVREKTFTLSDELNISPVIPIGEILKMKSDAEPWRMPKRVEQKAVIRGGCRTSILYRAAGGRRRIQR